MEKSVIEIEREAYRIRNEFIRDSARAVALYLKRKITNALPDGADATAAQAK